MLLFEAAPRMRVLLAALLALALAMVAVAAQTQQQPAALQQCPAARRGRLPAGRGTHHQPRATRPLAQWIRRRRALA